MIKKDKSSEIKLGTGHNIDEDVILGYRPGRKVISKELVVGKKARIRSGSVIYLGSSIGHNLETGHNVIIREENKIGNHFSIWNNSIVDYGCRIGNQVKVHSNVYIAQFTEIEDDVFLAPGISIANDPHPGCRFSKKCMRGPIIKKGAKIGINVTLLPLITIGEYSLIGAGSVVTMDIPPYSVAYGNPARLVKSIYELKCLTGSTDKPYKKRR